jgi:hypothetical protein
MAPTIPSPISQPSTTAMIGIGLSAKPDRWQQRSSDGLAHHAAPA